MSAAPHIERTEAEESTQTPPVTWSLVHAEPGALVYSTPGLPPGRPVARHAAGRSGGWTPAGTMTLPPAKSEDHTTADYARFIGRVGLLAAALGLGAAVVGQPGIATAQPADTDSSTSTSESAEESSSTSTQDTATTDETSTDTDTSTAESGSTSTSSPETPASSSETSTTVSAPGDAAPEVTISSSGGAHTSDTPAEAPAESSAPTEIAPEPAVEQAPAATTETPTASTPLTETAERESGRRSVTPAPTTAPLPSTPTGSAPTLRAPAPVSAQPTQPTPVPVTAQPSLATTAATAESRTVTPTSAELVTPAPVGLISRVISIVLAPFSPASATPAAAQAAQAPVVWGLFAWVRRTFFNSTPTVSYDPTQTTQVDNAITGHLTGLDADNDALTYTATQPANGGAVTFAPGGTFTYTAPASMYSTGGTDSFTVTVTDADAAGHIHGLSGLLNMITFGVLGDGGHTTSTTINLDVAAVNAAPIPGSPAFTLGEVDHTSGAVAGAIHATDPNQDALKYTLAGGPVDGSVLLNLTSGTFTYTPNLDARHDAAATPIVDVDNFSVTVDDQHGGVINVPVSVAIDPTNVPPTITGLVLSEADAATGAVHVSIAVADPDRDPAVYLVIHDPASGTVTTDPLGGGVIYTPSEAARIAAAYTLGTDTDTFDVSVSDLHGGETAPQPVVVEISPVNIAPVAVNDTIATAEDTPVTGNVLANDTDVDPTTTLTVASHTDPAHGTLVLSPNGSFTYAPAQNWSGTDSFSYAASDGTLTSDPATVTINVTPINDAPIAHDTQLNTDEDTALTGNVLDHVTDVDTAHAALTANLGAGPQHAQSFALNPDGSFTYTPAQNWSGTDSFTYTASDSVLTSNTATVTIDVKAVNDAPVAADDTYTATEDTPLTVPAPGVLVNDTDVDSPTLTVTDYTQPAHGSVTVNTDGSFTYTPDHQLQRRRTPSPTPPPTSAAQATPPP